jgi:L-aminopeptidase/D-esterase-like protein
VAQVGIARTVDPCHTVFDGDALFALSLGGKEADINVLSLAAAETVAMAIIRSILQAETIGGVPAARDINKC